MTHLAEAYFHFKRFEISERRLERLGREASASAAFAASGLFSPDSEIEVVLERGSLKGWCKVIGIGLLVATYHVVVDYKSLKENLPLIVHDAREYGNTFLEAFLPAIHIPPQQVYRTERRTKTPGKLLRVLERREWLAAHRAQLSSEVIKRETEAIEVQIKNVLEDLRPEEQPIVRKLLEEEGTTGRSDEEPDHPLPKEEEEPLAIEEKGTQGDLFDPESLHRDKLLFHDRFRLGEWRSDRNGRVEGVIGSFKGA